MKTQKHKEPVREAAGVGIVAVLEKITAKNRALGAKPGFSPRAKVNVSLLLLDYLRGAKMVAIAAVLVLSASILRADGYNTYVGNAGLVTIAQKEQAKHEREQELAFRAMSIVDRWNQNDAGSLARRWSDTGPGSIAARWEKK